MQFEPLIQPKIKIGKPNDRYEQEADAMADQVVQTPSPPAIQRKCEDCEEEQLQMKPLSADAALMLRKPLADDSMIQKKEGVGDLSTQGLHEDLGQAYSEDTGVPNQGGIQYTQGYAGWLTANTPSTQWLPTVEIPVNPLERLKTGDSAGKTFALINGVRIDGAANMGAYIDKVVQAITPVVLKSKPGEAGQLTCQFDPVFKLKFGTEIIITTPPQADGWRANVPPARLGSPPACTGQAEVSTVLKGKPNHGAYQNLIRDSELEHVAALKELYERHLIPFYNFAMQLSASGDSEEDCKTQLTQQLGQRPFQAALGFILGDMAEGKRFDDPSSTHHGTMTITSLGTNCDEVTLESSQNNPQDPAAGPGNVRTVPANVQAIDIDKLTVSGNDLMMDTTVVDTFSSNANALQALSMLVVNQVTEIHTIGAFQIAFSNGAPPILSLHGVAELPLDATLIQVTLGIRNPADWVISEVRGKEINEIVNFGANRDAAYTAVEMLRQNNVTHKAWVGSATAPEFSYFLKK